MEDVRVYDEDPWEYDWEWPEEPQVTYRQAIERLRGMIQGRADVRIDWNGQRGLPRDDARIVFIGGSGSRPLPRLVIGDHRLE